MGVGAEIYKENREESRTRKYREESMLFCIRLSQLDYYWRKLLCKKTLKKKEKVSDYAPKVLKILPT